MDWKINAGEKHGYCSATAAEQLILRVEPDNALIIAN